MSNRAGKPRTCVVGMALVALFGLLTAEYAGAADKELTIGVSDALTGGGATYGMPQMNAIKLAVDEINGKGGINVAKDKYKIKIIAYDDQANPTEATNSVRKLLDRDRVKYLLGFCCSPSTSAVASFIGKEDAVMLVGNAAERTITTRGLANLFRTRPPADYSGTAAGVFVGGKGVKRLAVIGALDIAFYALYLEAFEKEFVKTGGEIIAKETFSLKDRDMTPQLTKVRALNPDALLVIGYIEPAAFVYRQSIELGMKVQRFGFTSGNEEQFLTVATSEQMEGVWDLRPTELTLEALKPSAKVYYDSYKEKFGITAMPASPYAYDQVYVLKHALEKAGTVEDTKKVISEIANMPIPAEAIMKYLPIHGKMFDVNGQAYTTNSAFQWHNGKWQYVADLPSDPAAYSVYLRSLRK